MRSIWRGGSVGPGETLAVVNSTVRCRLRIQLVDATP